MRRRQQQELAPAQQPATGKGKGKGRQGSGRASAGASGGWAACVEPLVLLVQLGHVLYVLRGTRTKSSSASFSQPALPMGVALVLLHLLGLYRTYTEHCPSKASAKGKSGGSGGAARGDSGALHAATAVPTLVAALWACSLGALDQGCTFTLEVCFWAMAATSLALNPLIHMASVAVVMVSEFATGGFALRDGVALAAGFIIATAQLHELLFNIVVRCSEARLVSFGEISIVCQGLSLLCGWVLIKTIARVSGNDNNEDELNLFSAAPSYNFFKDEEVEREDYRREGQQVWVVMACGLMTAVLGSIGAVVAGRHWYTEDSWMDSTTMQEKQEKREKRSGGSGGGGGGGGGSSSTTTNRDGGLDLQPAITGEFKIRPGPAGKKIKALAPWAHEMGCSEKCNIEKNAKKARSLTGSAAGHKHTSDCPIKYATDAIRRNPNTQVDRPLRFGLEPRSKRQKR